MASFSSDRKGFKKVVMFRNGDVLVSIDVHNFFKSPLLFLPSASLDMAISSRYLVASASTVLLVILLASQSSLAQDEETITYSTTTSYIQKWHGEFIGAVNIPIDESIDGWEITITFEKNIWDFEVCIILGRTIRYPGEGGMEV